MIGVGLSIVQLAVRQLLGFDPKSLFAASEPGVWYDPSDLSTMFQDAAGTTPVTAVEQPVGLMLDKSKGLVLGPELVTNGTFDTADNWNLMTPWVIEGGQLTKPLISANSVTALTPVSATSGKTYKVTFTASGVTTMFAGFSTSPTGTSLNAGAFLVVNGKNTAYITTTAAPAAFGFVGNNGWAATIDNISVRELPGNHATQTTTTSRPVLSARYNLLTKTEQFDDAAWTKSNITAAANATTAPDGTLTADASTPNTANTFHTLTQSSITLQNTNYVLSVRAKANGYNFITLQIANSGSFTKYYEGVFNLSTGTVESTGRSVTYTGSRSIVSLGDGWYECSITVNSVDANSTAVAQLVVQSTNDPTVAFAGNGTSGIYIWGASLTPANQASLPYQRVNTATDYDADPSKFKPYLRFDGVDDWLVTPTITPGTDKVQVFAGVRKLSDAAVGVIAELSTDAGSVQGAIGLYSAFPANGYTMRSRGAMTADAASGTVYPSPITNVLTGLGDISGDSAILRVNGAQVATNTADQGTGNFLAYPLYIGRRGGTSLPFNGHLYGLIVRFGANLPAGTIASTESWVADKTGITL